MTDESERRIEKLLAESVAEAMDREQNAFDRVLRQFENRVVLFGAGNLGRRCLASLRESGIEPIGFSDNNPRLWGTTVDGLEVMAPDTAARGHGQRSVFLITIWHPSYATAETLAQLDGLGCARVLPVALFLWRHGLLPQGYIDLPSKVLREAAAVRPAFRLLSDEFSSGLYVDQLRLRMYADHGAAASACQEEQYFPEDLFKLRDEETFVDCGAYDGDTLRSFLQRRGQAFHHAYALEPDPVNNAKLHDFVRDLNSDVAAKITVSGCADGSLDGQIPFDTLGTQSSRACAEARDSVRCVRLDDFLAGASPTFLKMDIEGSERDAVAGAASMIRHARPLLAICAYHMQSDLWVIPNLIHSIVPDYRLFLRPHRADGWDLVCYGVPPERRTALEGP
jgi:FkbM family methyltransferase